MQITIQGLEKSKCLICAEKVQRGKYNENAEELNRAWNGEDPSILI